MSCLRASLLLLFLPLGAAQPRCFGTYSQKLEPPPDVDLSGLLEVDTNGLSACGIDAQGFVTCWAETAFNEKFAFQLPDQAVSWHLGNKLVCIVLPNPTGAPIPAGGIRCYDTTSALNPQYNLHAALFQGQILLAVATFQDSVYCILDHTGTPLCWLPNSNSFSNVPQAWTSNVGATMISANAEWACMMRAAGGDLMCWCHYAWASLPADLQSVTHAKAVDLFAGHMCILDVWNKIKCWDTNTLDAVSVATTLSNLAAPFSAVAAGGEIACAVSEAGQLLCWGGQLSIDPLPADTRVTSLGAGGGHVCILTETSSTAVSSVSSTHADTSTVASRAATAPATSTVLPGSSTTTLPVGTASSTLSTVTTHTTVTIRSSMSTVTSATTITTTDTTLTSTSTSDATTGTTTETTATDASSGTTVSTTDTATTTFAPPITTTTTAASPAAGTTVGIGTETTSATGRTSNDFVAGTEASTPVTTVGTSSAAVSSVTTTITSTEAGQVVSTEEARSSASAEEASSSVAGTATSSEGSSVATLGPSMEASSTTEMVADSVRTTGSVALQRAMDISTTGAEFATDTSTTAGPLLPQAGGNASLVESIAERYSSDLVMRALGSQGAAVVGSVPGLRLSAAALSPAGDVSLSIPNSEASALIPASVVSNLGLQQGTQVVAVLVVLDDDLLPDLGYEEAVAVRGAISFSFFAASPNGGAATRTRVEGLSEPIQLVIPTRRTPDSECAFWDESSGRWSAEGVWLIGGEGNETICATTHLSMFASIVRGYMKTFECTHINVLSAEGLAELLHWDWRGHPTFLAFLALLVLLLTMQTVACLLDCSRYRAHCDDRLFILALPRLEDFNSEEQLESERAPSPLAPTVQPGNAARASYRRQRSSFESEASQATTATTMSPVLNALMPLTLKTQLSRLSSVSPTPSQLGKIVPLQLSRQLSTVSSITPSRQHAKRCGHDCFAWCKTSSALRDAFDDVASRWFTYFSEVRDLVEGLCQGLQVKREPGEEATESRCARFWNAMMSSMVANFARRQAAASLGVSSEVVRFVMEGEAMHEVLQEAAAKMARGDYRNSKEEHWFELHEAAVHAMNCHWEKSANWRHFPLAAAKLFFVSNPMMSAFVACHFWSSSLRVLFVSVELLGSIVAATLFFEATGLTTSKRSRSACSMLTDPQEQIGRLLAIAMTSLLVASIPVCLMSSLHSRKFVRVDNEDCELAQRRLRLWRVQDRVLWVVGVLYCAACTFFILAFLANVHPAALASWSVVGYASVLQDALVIPLGVGLLVPVTSMAVLSAVSCWGWREKEEILQTSRRRWQRRPGNWFAAVDSV